MNLSTLPSEIISRVCRHLGLSFKYGLVHCENVHLHSLRLTCRELNQKTSADAAVRYGLLLDDLEIYLDHSGLCLLLHISKNAAFRNRITRLYFHAAPTKDVPADPNAPWLTSAVEAMEEEEVKTYLESREAVYLLSECFRNLRSARSLEVMEIYSNDGYNLVLSALDSARFPRKVAKLSIQPKQLSGHEYGNLSQYPFSYSPYIKNLTVEAPELDLDEPGMSPKQVLQQKKANNEAGYHFADYSPNHPNFLAFLSNLNQVETLELVGCQTQPRLRFCNSCHDVFAKHIAHIHYPHLTSIEISGMPISGGRLRRFIKQHAATLVNVSFSFATLTDGSWKSIAQGLIKLPKLDRLHLTRRLCQKSPSLATVSLWAPKPWRDPRSGFGLDFGFIDITGSVNVGQFLVAFVKHFRTHIYVHTLPYPPSRPQYYEVALLNLPGISKDWKSKAHKALERYAEEIAKPNLVILC